MFTVCNNSAILSQVPNAVLHPPFSTPTPMDTSVTIRCIAGMHVLVTENKQTVECTSSGWNTTNLAQCYPGIEVNG